MSSDNTFLKATGSGGNGPPGVSSVLLVVPWELGHTGGVNVVVRALVQELGRDRRIRPYVWILDWGAVRPRISLAGFHGEVRYRLRGPGGGSLRSMIVYLAGLMPRLLGLRRLMRRLRVEAVNVHYPKLSALNLVVLRRLWRGAPNVVVSFHGMDLTQAAGAKAWERRLWRWMLMHADAVTGCSQQLAREVEARFELPAGYVVGIHNGVDIQGLESAIQRAEKPEAMADDRRWLLNIATYEHKKGQDVLVEAFAALAPDFPDLGLVMIGRPAELLGTLRRRVAELGLKDRVRFVTDVPHAEIPRYLAGAEIFVLPSRSEPFGIVVLEAGVAGLPVVASRVGGVPEIIESGHNGVLIEAGDVLALSAAIRGVLDDPAYGRRLGSALKAHVSGNFSWRKTAEGYETAMWGGRGEPSV